MAVASSWSDFFSPLADLLALVLREIAEPVRPAQGLERQPQRRPPPHGAPPVLVGDHEHHVVPQLPQRRPFRTLPFVDPLREFGDGLPGVDGRRVVTEHDEFRPPVPHVVRHVEGAAREADRLEGFSREDFPDGIVQFGAGVPGVHLLFLAAQNLGQVRLGKEPHGDARPVVEIGRLRQEPLPDRLDEADVARRPQHGVPQPLGRDAP